MSKHFYGLIFYLIIFVQPLISQSEENIYFISGNSRDIGIISTNESNASSFYDKYYCKSNPLIIWRFTQDSLQVVDTLNINKKENGYFTKVRHFEDEGWIYLIERDADRTTSRFDKWKNLQDHGSILSYIGTDSIILRRYNIDSIFGNRFFKPLKSYYIQNQIYTSCATCEKFDIPYWTLCNKSMDTIQYIRNWKIELLNAKFESGFQDHFSFTSLIYNLDGKFKTKKLTTNADEWEPINFYVPPSHGDGLKYKLFNICYVTPKSRYLMGYKEKFKNADSIVLMYIHEKNIDFWDSIRLPRHYTKFNVYKDEYAFGTGMKRWLENNAESDIDKSISENKHKYDSDYGCTPDLRRAMGRFFILHLPTKTFDEMIFDERDVELLAIKNGLIYYRK